MCSYYIELKMLKTNNGYYFIAVDYRKLVFKNYNALSDPPIDRIKVK